MDEKDVFKVPKKYENDPEKIRELEREHYAANVRHKGEILTRAGKMYREGTLPKNFKDWDLPEKKGGQSIQMRALVEGKLPSDFDGWLNKEGRHGIQFAEVAISLCRFDDIPKEIFNKPSSMLISGTIAHNAVSDISMTKSYFEKMMDGFDGWENRNDRGETVYHIAARSGRLPDGFDKWDLEANGFSVAHYAVSGYGLPKTFDRWDIVSNGISIVDAYKEDITKEIHGANIKTISERMPSSTPEEILLSRAPIETYVKRKGPQHGECSIAHLYAANNKLPDNFPGWNDRIDVDVQNVIPGFEGGNTVYHVAAANGNLPDNFQDWGLKGHEGNTVAHYAVRSLDPPKGIDNWEERNNKGKTVLAEHLFFLGAHLFNQKLNGGQAVPHLISKELADKMVAMSSSIDGGAGQYARHLPPEFDKWDHKTLGEQTFAHEAAKAGYLPPHFDKWDMVDESGVTVAHMAARAYCLPPDFDKWGMADKDGNTVAHVAAFACAGLDDSSRLVLPKEIEHWHAKNADGETVIDVARKHGGGSFIEETYASALANDMASSIHGAAPAPELSYKEAAQALRDGTLPADFNDWSKKNSDGWTLAHAAAALGKLPPDFKDWGMEGAKPGITVAHIAMRYSELPASFDDWGLKDASGKTLGEVAVKHPKLGAEYQARIEASKQAQQPNIETRAPEPQAAKPSSEAPVQGGKNNQVAPIETSSTGRITGGGRFSRPPDLSNREPEPERRPIKAFISRGM